VAFDEWKTVNLDLIIEMGELKEGVREKQGLIVHFGYRTLHVEEPRMSLIEA
jgi:hypothetical protein